LKKSGPKGVRIPTASELWKPDGVAKTKSIPAYKNLPNFGNNVFEVLFGICKIVILVL
jgi:hypothetical protein